MNAAVVHRIGVFPLSIPVHSQYNRPASERAAANPIVVEIEFTNGTIGFGEALPQGHVTGETGDSFIEAVRRIFAPALLGFHPTSFPEALEAIDALPWKDAEGTLVPAARAGVELALLDAAVRHFERTADDFVQWMSLAGFGSPGCLRRIRFSGLQFSGNPASTNRQLRRMYWNGLRDFKLKVGAPGDIDRVRRAAAYLARPIAAGRATLRVDADGAWTADEAAAWLAAASDIPLAAVEQPLPRGDENRLPELRERSSMPFIHDESLITEDDAQRLLGLGVADVFNIRIDKCGGFLPSLRLAAFARKHNLRIVLGGTIGQTGVLSAAGLRFLEVCPMVSWAEGCLGSFFLRGDVTLRSLRFGHGGRPPRLVGAGWGIDVDRRRLKEFAAAEPVMSYL